MAELLLHLEEALFGALLVALLLFAVYALRSKKKLPVSDKGGGGDKGGGEASLPRTQKGILSKTAGRLFAELRRSFGSGERDEIFRVLERSLLSGDVGVKTTEDLLADLRASLPEGDLTLPTFEKALRERMASIFDERDGAPLRDIARPTVIALVGVNGVGKTTTAGKLAYLLAAQGKKVVLAACDTFRAAAPEQLKIWAERSGSEIIFGSEGMKPATVAFQALERSRNADYLIIDTAGRLHTKGNLMQELRSVLDLVAREAPGAPHETILVVDATSGQNALEQAKAFHSVCPLSGIIITKLDGTPRGGMLFAIRRELGIPVRFIGLGEKAEQLSPFNPAIFLEELFETEGEEERDSEMPQRVVRRRNQSA